MLIIIMIYMKRRFIITTAALFSLVFVLTAQAQLGRGYGRGFNQGFWNSLPSLNLSKNQLKEFNSLRQGFIKDTASIWTQLQQKNLDMSNLLMDAEPDTKKVGSVQKDISELQSKLNETRVSYQLKAKKILTPDQIAQLPPGCNFGFGNMIAGSGPGYGCGMGRGYGCGMGRGYGRCW